MGVVESIDDVGEEMNEESWKERGNKRRGKQFNLIFKQAVISVVKLHCKALGIWLSSWEERLLLIACMALGAFPGIGTD